MSISQEDWWQVWYRIHVVRDTNHVRRETLIESICECPVADACCFEAVAFCDAVASAVKIKHSQVCQRCTHGMACDVKRIIRSMWHTADLFESLHHLGTHVPPKNVKSPVHEATLAIFKVDLNLLPYVEVGDEVVKILAPAERQEASRFILEGANKKPGLIESITVYHFDFAGG